MVNNCGFNGRFNNGFGCGTPVNARYQTPYSRQNNSNTRNSNNTRNSCDSCDSCNTCETCNTCNSCDTCDMRNSYDARNTRDVRDTRNTRNSCNNCDSCDNRNNCDNCERKQLLDNIRAYAFAIIDIGLYLDTNPECEFALEYYNTYRDLYKESVALYEANYGPLSIYGNEDDDRWKWNCAPWPWEGGNC